MVENKKQDSRQRSWIRGFEFDNATAGHPLRPLIQEAMNSLSEQGNGTSQRETNVPDPDPGSDAFWIRDRFFAAIFFRAFGVKSNSMSNGSNFFPAQK